MNKKKLNSVLLIDDDEPTTFMYKMVLEESGCADHVHIAYGGTEALEFFDRATEDLKGQASDYPDLIFLDINMPRMDGWEFLQEFKELSIDKQRKSVIVMLSTSLNPDDEFRAKGINAVAAFRHKPLTIGMVREIVGKYF